MTSLKKNSLPNKDERADSFVDNNDMAFHASDSLVGAAMLSKDDLSSRHHHHHHHHNDNNNHHDNNNNNNNNNHHHHHHHNYNNNHNHNHNNHNHSYDREQEHGNIHHDVTDSNYRRSMDPVPSSPMESSSSSVSVSDLEKHNNSTRGIHESEVLHKHSKSSSGISTTNISINTLPPTTADMFNCGPKSILLLFFVLAFFVYFDRGSLAATLEHIQEQVMDDNTEKGGVFASSYLFGYCVTSPLFALLGSYFSPMKMSSLGMLVWCGGVFGTSILDTFGTLLGARLLTGIGEASFLSFSSTIIDVIAPFNHRALYLGTFYMAMPFGYAFGYALGGVLASSGIYNKNGNDESWRIVFIAECIIMFPFTCALFFMKSPRNMLVLKDIKKHFTTDIQSDFHEEIDDPWYVKTKRIVMNPSWFFIVMGYSTQTFVTGTFGVLAIEYLNKAYGWSSATAGPIFGGLTLISGLIGSMTGGIVLDKLKARVPEESPDHYFLKPTVTFLCWLSFLAFPFAFIVFLIDSIVLFLICAFVAMFLIFASTGPCNNAVLWSVLYKDRPLAMSFSTFSIHALGDALAPTLVGAMIQIRYHSGYSKKEAYNFAMAIACLWLLLSGFCFLLTGRFLKKLYRDLEAMDEDLKKQKLQALEHQIQYKNQMDDTADDIHADLLNYPQERDIL